MAPQLTSIPHLSHRALVSLDDLAWAIDRDGIANHEAAVTEMAAIAEDHDVCAVLVGAVRDRTLTDATRERAFGLLAMSLARSVGGVLADYATAA